MKYYGQVWRRRASRTESVVLVFDAWRASIELPDRAGHSQSITGYSGWRSPTAELFDHTEGMQL